ncbi:MAG: leucine-rich repeat domain-containing protein, partial [Eubacteriales bacterium]
MMMKKMRIVAIFLAICVVFAVPFVVFAEDTASIPDAKLENALRELLEKDDSDTLLPSELATLTGEIDLSHLGITNIRGIEYLTGATSIDLSGNSIETMSSHMDKLVNLESLDLSEDSGRYDFPGAVLDIPNLKSLSLAASKIRILPSRVSEMTALETLDISANRLDEFPTVLLEMQLVNLNIDYNFLDLREGTADRNRIDAMSDNVSGEYLAFRQFGRLQNLTYYTSGGKIVVEWDGIDDITFYDGTVASVKGYTVLVSGVFVENTGASKRSIQIDAVA